MLARSPRLLVLAAAVIAAAVACGGPTVHDLANLGGDRNPTPTPTPPNGMHHPVGWASPDQHGHAAKFVTEDCRGCHGLTLEGGSAVSCDSCHVAGWKEDCTYCHGGTDNATGAPPRDITGAISQDDLIFKSHTKHIETAVATPFTCVQCHGTMPTDALSEGHWFDDTPGRAEVVFANGLSPAGVYNYDSGRCSQLYCHGNGQGNNGAANYSDGPKACNGCHPFQNSAAATIGTMSGEHRRHIVNENAACNECHGMTVNAQDAISNAAVHVNGTVEFLFTGTNVTYNAGAGTCNGTCHGDTHNNEDW